MDKFLTVADVAATLKVSTSTVRRAIKARRLGIHRVGRGQIRVSQSQLEEYLSSNRSTEKPKSPASSLTSELTTVSSIIDSASQSAPIVRSALTNQGLSWEVITADALAGLQTLPDESVNCIVTSPPYYWQRDYEVEGQIGHEPTIDGFVSTLRSVFREAQRVLRDDGVLFLNIGDTYYSAKGKPHGRDQKHRARQLSRRKLRAVDGPGLGLPRKSLIGLPWRVTLAMQEDNWVLRSSIIWQRPAPMPEPTAKDRPWRTHEPVFLMSKLPRYWFNREALDGEDDIWNISAHSANPGSHFAPYPLEFADRCVRAGCPKGGTVLDPFVGSGTTMISALNHGMSAIGIDIKDEYSDFTATRIGEQFPSSNVSQAADEEAAAELLQA